MEIPIDKSKIYLVVNDDNKMMASMKKRGINIDTIKQQNELYDKGIKYNAGRLF